MYQVLKNSKAIQITTELDREGEAVKNRMLEVRSWKLEVRSRKFDPENSQTNTKHLTTNNEPQ